MCIKMMKEHETSDISRTRNLLFGANKTLEDHRHSVVMSSLNLKEQLDFVCLESRQREINVMVFPNQNCF